MGFYPEMIQEAFDEIQDSRMKVFGLIEAARVAEEAEETFKDQIKGFRLSAGWHMGTLQGILIFCDVNDMAEVTPLLQWLAKKGYPKKGKPEDYPEIKRRTWECGKINISAFLPYSGGSKCEFVKIGVKEEPIYELQCKEK